MIQIVPSIASSNLLEIGEEVRRVTKVGYLHLDVEDGNFSPDITFGMDMIQAVAEHTNAVLDAHLMVSDPLKYIDPLCDCGVEWIAPHIESTLYPSEPLGKIHARGKKAGLALNYKTDVRELEPYFDQLDYVLLQTSEAGDTGLSFREFCFEKIARARKLLPKHISLWADGGITGDILPRLAQCGLDHAVMGRAIFGAKDPQAEYIRLMGMGNAAASL